MRSDTRNALVGRLSRYETVVEVGVGQQTAVAAALADHDVTVTATDVRPCTTPAEVSFVSDDVTDPDPAVYAEADAVYALNLPPELHRSLVAVARTADADWLFTTLGADPPAVTAVPETLPGETLYTAAEAVHR